MRMERHSKADSNTMYLFIKLHSIEFRPLESLPVLIDPWSSFLDR
jgi:hypothetical protein